MNWRVRLGWMTAEPLAARCTALASSWASMSLSRYPAAPAWMDSPTRAWVSSTVSMTTRALGTVREMVWVAPIPPRMGMRTSISTTSGLTSSARSTASWPSLASATTSSSASRASAALMPSRVSGWSSATRMRTMSPIPPPSPDDLFISIVPLQARRMNPSIRTGPRPHRAETPTLGEWSGDAHPAALPAAQRAPLLLGQTTPDTRILGRVQRPLETLLTDGAERTDSLGRLHLGLGRTGGADREEQLGVDIAAAGTMAPIH